ncbi:hypothetical protein BRARA_A03101 [Brassica rapa]|uniref:DUF4283 domain-containing protein n=1 Tax=Brassica campestris TaxID=3711 RepID=A0A398ARU0_BRACM|nr:hypothetical protein BRARA_A03101 [Brassica rapa]
MNDFFYGCLPYIKESVWVSSITISKLFSFLLRNFSVVIISLVSMNQGQLVGNGGASKEGEGVRKRLKISVPHFDNSDLIKSYAMTLIGRCMNPEKQKVNALLMMLPKIWKVEERVTGADLGKGMFQIHFEKEEDIEAVLESQPYHFDYWMISIARWQPRMSRSFPSEIPFWIKVDGLPTEFWSTPALQSIGDAIGETTDVDLDFGKMRVVLDGFKELTLETTVEFKGGEFYDEEEVPVSLKYEKLFGICKLCSSLCHDEDLCPLNPKSTEGRTDCRGEAVTKSDDRARSYRGVVIHGEENQQVKGKKQRSYYGKGKGKMHEEDDSQWVRVPERGNKKFSHYNNNRAEEGNTRYINSRWEQPRNYVQDTRERGYRGTRRGRSPPHYVREDPKEEGELQDTGSANRGFQLEGKTSASNNPPHESNGANVNLVKVASKPLGLETSARAVIALDSVGVEKELVPQLVDTGKDTLGTEGMDLEEAGNPIEGDEGLMCDDADFQNLTDGEMEELNVSHEVVLATVEEETRSKETEEKGIQGGEEEKKKGARKLLLKQTMAAGTSKKKFVQAILSHYKNAHARQGKRQGEGIKLHEERDSSNPKLTSSKNSNASHG